MIIIIYKYSRCSYIMKRLFTIDIEILKQEKDQKGSYNNINENNFLKMVFMFYLIMRDSFKN